MFVAYGLSVFHSSLTSLTKETFGVLDTRNRTCAGMGVVLRLDIFAVDSSKLLKVEKSRGLLTKKNFLFDFVVGLEAF